MSILDTVQEAFSGQGEKTSPSRHVILSDVDGTLSIRRGENNFPNLPLIQFLLDADAKGHAVYIATGGNPSPARDILELACMRVGREFPDSIKVLSKGELGEIAKEVTIAFDDRDFDYLAGNQNVRKIKVDMVDPLSLPFDELRRMTGTTDSPYASPAPAPSAP